MGSATKTYVRGNCVGRPKRLSYYGATGLVCRGQPLACEPRPPFSFGVVSRRRRGRLRVAWWKHKVRDAGSKHIALEIQLNSPQKLDGHGKISMFYFPSKSPRKRLQIQSRCFQQVRPDHVERENLSWHRSGGCFQIRASRITYGCRMPRYSYGFKCGWRQ